MVTFFFLLSFTFNLGLWIVCLWFFFKVCLGGFVFLFFYFYFYSIILVIWGSTTINNDEIGRILFSPKINWNSQKYYDVFAYSQSVGILELFIMDFSQVFVCRHKKSLEPILQIFSLNCLDR